MSGRVPELWTPERYCRFAVEHQLLSLWQIASFIVRFGRSVDAFSPASAAVVDLGAGPGLVAHLVAHMTGREVHAVVQDERFHALARGLPLPRGMSAPDLVRLHVASDASSMRWDGRAQLIYSYACLHEQRDPTATIAGAYDALAPGGTLLVLDTLGECADEMESALAGSDLAAEDRAAILGTFRASLSLELARSVFRSVCPRAEVAPLSFDDELLLESSLSMPCPARVVEGPVLERPTLFVATCRKPASRTEQPA